MTQFKVGDKVITHKFAPKTADDPLFVSSMLGLVGTVGVIEFHNKCGWGVRHPSSHRPWTWPERALTKAEGVRHPFADVIIAWANGAKVQFRLYDALDEVWTEWKDTDNPGWSGFGHRAEYRVKPEPKPDFFRYAQAQSDEYAYTYWRVQPDEYSNVKATFDGETGKLKAVEFLSK